MSKGHSTPAPQVTPINREQVFAQKYQKFCKEEGFQIVPVPLWVQSKDTGDWRMMIQLQPMPLQEDNDR